MTDNRQNPNSGPVSIWPAVLKYGLIVAAFRIVYNLILYATGLVGTTGLGLVGIIGAIVLLVIALKRFRGLSGGYMTFGQAFGICLFASVISTALRAIADTIYLATMGAEFMAAQRERMLDQLTANPAMDPQALQSIEALLNSIFTPGGLLITALITGIIGWLVLSLIIAATMKNPPPISDS
jgi:Protein of unknown function (DUF4199)